jgi:hypothetical protein
MRRLRSQKEGCPPFSSGRRHVHRTVSAARPMFKSHSRFGNRPRVAGDRGSNSAAGTLAMRTAKVGNHLGPTGVIKVEFSGKTCDVGFRSR